MGAGGFVLAAVVVLAPPLLTARGAVPMKAPLAAPDPHNAAFTRGLGVECAHCHAGEDWKSPALPAFAIAGRMDQMVRGLSDGSLKSRGGVTCYTCHRGSSKPGRIPRASWQALFDEWPASATVAPANLDKPAGSVYGNLRVLTAIPAANVRLTMSVIAASLGVNCEYCHAADEWGSDYKPAKETARAMLTMFSELPTYFEGVPAPTFQCYTCHQGSLVPER